MSNAQSTATTAINANASSPLPDNIVRDLRTYGAAFYEMAVMHDAIVALLQPLMTVDGKESEDPNAYATYKAISDQWRLGYDATKQGKRGSVDWGTVKLSDSSQKAWERMVQDCRTNPDLARVLVGTKPVAKTEKAAKVRESRAKRAAEVAAVVGDRTAVQLSEDRAKAAKAAADAAAKLAKAAEQAEKAKTESARAAAAAKAEELRAAKLEAERQAQLLKEAAEAVEKKNVKEAEEAARKAMSEKREAIRKALGDLDAAGLDAVLATIAAHRATMAAKTSAAAAPF